MNQLEHFNKYVNNRLLISDLNYKSMDLSDGINHFPPPNLYIEYYIQEVNKGMFIQQYSSNSGNSMLVSMIRIYEKMLSCDDLNIPDNFANNICITAGATASIFYFIEFFANKFPNSKVLLLGLNYYLFCVSFARYGLEFKSLCSHEKGRIAPTVEEIIDTIKFDNYKLVVLTMPMNPSGETYSEIELSRIVSALKQYGIYLLYDKCQDEPGIESFESININKIILKYKFEEYTVIVNSLSKTRSIPGARLGWVIANKEIIEYITFMNEMTYYNPPHTFIIPFIVDLIYRILYLKMKDGFEIGTILSKLKKTILLNISRGNYIRHFLEIFKDTDLLKKITEFYMDINERYKIINENYRYLIDNKSKYLYDLTSLNGGYNFCVKFINTQSKNQVKFCNGLAEKTGLGLLPECYFNNGQIEDTIEPFWIRLTVSSPHLTFVEMIDSVSNYIEYSMEGK